MCSSNDALSHSCRWEGSGLDETGRDRKSGKVRVRVDQRYLRPTEVVSVLFASYSGVVILLVLLHVDYLCCLIVLLLSLLVVVQSPLGPFESLFIQNQLSLSLHSLLPAAWE